MTITSSNTMTQDEIEQQINVGKTLLDIERLKLIEQMQLRERDNYRFRRLRPSISRDERLRLCIMYKVR